MRRWPAGGFAAAGLKSTPVTWNQAGSLSGFRSMRIPSLRITAIDRAFSYSVVATIASAEKFPKAQPMTARAASGA